MMRWRKGKETRRRARVLLGGVVVVRVSLKLFRNMTWRASR